MTTSFAHSITLAFLTFYFPISHSFGSNISPQIYKNHKNNKYNNLYPIDKYSTSKPSTFYNHPYSYSYQYPYRYPYRYAHYRYSSLRSEQIMEAITLNSVFALISYYLKQPFLTNYGLLHSWFLAIILWTTLNWKGWSIAIVYFIFGSIATKIRFKHKLNLGIAEARNGRRGPENVWGSAATAALCSISSILYPSLSNIFYVGFVASLATKLSDTSASEIGKAYGKTTYLITTLKQVSPGTEGAISLEGTIAGIIGSLILTIYAISIGFINNSALIPSILAAFIATNIESIIGATLQNKYYFLTNEVVNFINTFIGAIIAMLLYIIL